MERGNSLYFSTSCLQRLSLSKYLDKIELMLCWGNRPNKALIFLKHLIL